MSDTHDELCERNSWEPPPCKCGCKIRELERQVQALEIGCEHARRLQDQVVDLRRQLETTRKDFQEHKDGEYQKFLDWRGVENRCDRCGGSGSRLYSNTTTWHGGAGGQALTNGICDRCWGSGDVKHPWLNLRGYERQLETIRNDTLEEAAKVCETTGSELGYDKQQYYEDCADAIRKLKQAP